MKNLKNYSRWAMSAFIVLIALLFFSTVEVKAQNVKISPNSGKLIAALTYSNEVGFENGWSATWRHEQLPLTLTVADDPDLTPAGQLKIPAGNINVNDGNFVIMGGKTKDFYMAVTLPKGYKFTEYRMVVLNNLNGKKIKNMDIENHNGYKSLHETNKNFGDYKATALNSSNSNQMPNKNSDNNEYVIQRISSSSDEMGNTLYFRIVHTGGNYFYGVTIKSFEIYFTAEGDFAETIVPTSVNSTPRSYVEAPFSTSKIDLGPIELRKKNHMSQLFYSYDYDKIADLKANLMLYQEDAISAGKPGDYADVKKITSVSRNGKNYYALKDGTYYIETPMEMQTQNDITLYQGYRIVGAKIKAVKGGKTSGYAGNENISYKLKVYDKTGKKVTKEIVINENGSTNLEEEIVLNNLNNDAVKFEISEIRDLNTPSNSVPDYGAYLTFEVTMQALNPYINSMNIVCQEKGGPGRKLTQQFTSNDFSVRGGSFTYYVPEDFVDPCIFTFEDLRSNYGDETYYGDTNSKHYSRYSLVKSPYWNDNSDLYSPDYDPDYSFEGKVHAEVAGNKPFRFNNADELENTTTSNSVNYLKEFPFSLQEYENVNTTNGKFEEVSLSGNKSTTAYLFTCDETRYNIAPSTAIQHRYYAYYIMEITLVKKTYTGDYKWKKIYDKTVYVGEDGKESEASQWGLELLTDKLEGGAQGDYGYLLVSQVLNYINETCVTNNSNGPESKEQILYIDGSKLQGLPTSEGYTLDKLKEGLGANVLIYLPYNTSTTDIPENFAAKQRDNSFRSSANFVLQDRKPFYAPYDISIDESKTCKYTRNVTIDKNGKVGRATIILPFEISVDPVTGVHKNEDGSMPFSLHQMQASDCLSQTPHEGEVNHTYAFFPNITNMSKTTANTPYLVKVLAVNNEDNVTFVVTQSGTLIKATKDMDSDYTFKGETATGNYNGISYSFEAHGSYAGRQMPKGEHYYYYNRNSFVCSDGLDPKYAHATLYPFRTYYKGNGPASGMLPAFGVIFGDGEGETDPTGIVNADEVPDLVISTETGMLTMASSISQEVDIRNLNGILVNRISIGAGETLSVTLPAGIYIVNGTKLIVK